MTEEMRQIAIEKTIKRIKVVSILLAICLFSLCLVCYAQNVSSTPPAIPYDKVPTKLHMETPDLPMNPIDESILEELDGVNKEETQAETEQAKVEQVTEILNEEIAEEEVPTEEAPTKEPEVIVTKNPAYSYTQAELDLLAKLIFHEAGGECYEGQVAVGAVVLNRVRAQGFPNNIYDVIYAKNQFSPVRSSKWNNPVPSGTRVYEAALEALNGTDPTNGALYFYNPKTSTSSWIFTRPVVKVIGNHNFAK